MKKKLLYVLMIVCGLTLAGCGKKDSSNSTTNEIQQDAEELQEDYADYQEKQTNAADSKLNATIENDTVNVSFYSIFWETSIENIQFSKSKLFGVMFQSQDFKILNLKTDISSTTFSKYAVTPYEIEYASADNVDDKSESLSFSEIGTYSYIMYVTNIYNEEDTYEFPITINVVDNDLSDADYATYTKDGVTKEDLKKAFDDYLATQGE